MAQWFSGPLHLCDALSNLWTLSFDGANWFVYRRLSGIDLLLYFTYYVSYNNNFGLLCKIRQRFNSISMEVWVKVLMDSRDLIHSYRISKWHETQQRFF